MPDRPDEATLARYLLGDCAETESAQLEEQFFVDDEMFDRLCEVEEDLIGRYERGELRDEQRGQFERAYSSPRRRERALLNIALRRYASTQPGAETLSAVADQKATTTRPAEKPRWWSWLTVQPLPIRFALASIALAFTVSLAVLMWQTAQLQSSLDAARRATQMLQREASEAAARANESERKAAALADQLARSQAAALDAPPSSAARPLVASFVLSPGLTRGARTPTRIRVPQTADLVRLQLNLETDVRYREFRSEVKTTTGEVVWSENIAARDAARTGMVRLTLPAALIANGEYEVALRGVDDAGRTEDVAEYYFEAVRR